MLIVLVRNVLNIVEYGLKSTHKEKQHKKKSPAASICDRAFWENDFRDTNYSTIKVDFIVAWPGPHMTEHWMV
jgi:hypothetical protein